MRRLLLLACLSTLAPAAVAVAAFAAAPGDGTLSVRDARATIVLDVNGSVVGRFDRGTLTVTDPIDDDGLGPLVRGAERVRLLSAATTTFAGSFIRFRLIGGHYIVRIKGGTGVDLSVVGRGTVILDGDLVGANGEYSFNGEDYQPMPFQRTRFALNATTVAWERE
jgi:hypothetical protein